MKRRSSRNKLGVLRSRLNLETLAAVFIIAAIGMIGVRFVWTSQAAGSVTSTEAEAGTLAGGAKVVQDAQASGGKAVAYSGSAGGGGINADCSKGTMLSVVAHEDDDLLQINPDIYKDIVAGKCVRIVYVTAGDDNYGSAYWHNREAGEKDTYSQMANMPNQWTESDAGVAGRPITLFTLNNDPKISLVFMRLPDGDVGGEGFSNDGYQSLRKIWEGSISTITPLDGRPSYTKQQLVSVMATLMANAAPDTIRTLDWLNESTDHTDHHVSALIAQAAHKQYAKRHTIYAYMGYDFYNEPNNLSSTDAANKQRFFAVYAPYDRNICSDSSSCDPGDSGVYKMYITASEQGGN